MFRPYIKWMQRILGLTVLLFLTGCALDLPDFVESGAINLIIAEKNASYIRDVQVVLKEDTTIVKGFVRRGIKSHIPHLYQGHVDLSITDMAGITIESSTIQLRSKQERFSYKMTSRPFTAGAVRVAYFKTSHSSHRTF